jgi:hypothetical protein
MFEFQSIAVAGCAFEFTHAGQPFDQKRRQQCTQTRALLRNCPPCVLRFYVPRGERFFGATRLARGQGRETPRLIHPPEPIDLEAAGMFRSQDHLTPGQALQAERLESDQE